MGARDTAERRPGRPGNLLIVETELLDGRTHPDLDVEAFLDLRLRLFAIEHDARDSVAWLRSGAA